MERVVDKFELEEPVKYQPSHWWHGSERLTPEWMEWTTKKSEWKYKKMNSNWDAKTCPFVDGHCTKTKCVHFALGRQYKASPLTIEWYGSDMFDEHKCKLWGGRR